MFSQLGVAMLSERAPRGFFPSGGTPRGFFLSGGMGVSGEIQKTDPGVTAGRRRSERPPHVN